MPPLTPALPLTAPLDLVTDRAVYVCVVGSRAYGLAHGQSDTDRRGVYVAPTELFWGLDKPPSHVDGPLEEQFSWELERYCELALQANPTVLECLWSPIVEHITPVGHELLELRSAFVSRRVAQSYGGYARDQFRRLEASRQKSNAVKWKQAMHMLRLLLAGAHMLRTGEILVDVRSDRERRLMVKRGELSWEEIQAWASTLEEKLRDAADRSLLPEEPNRDAINDFLIRTRRANL